jgi:hypothetical protein
LDLQV